MAKSHLNSCASVVTALVLVASSNASAEDRAWYATANAGFGSLSSSTLTYSDGTSTSSADAGYESSFTVGGTVGYTFSNNLSLEGELTYRRNDLDPVTLGGLGTFSDGDFASLALAVNALFRFDIGSSGKLSGYAGPGFVYFEEIDIDFDSDGQQEISFENDDTALQLKFGARYTFSDRLFAEAGITYLAAESVRMALPANGAETVESDYDHWNFAVGVGYRF